MVRRWQLAALLWLASACLVNGASLLPSESGELPVNPEILARTACSICHLYPQPNLLDKQVWRDEVLPKMKFYLGVDQIDIQKTKDGPSLKASGLFPSTPMIPKENWPAIEKYYLEKAPERTNPPSRNPLIPLELKQFALERPKFRREPPLTTALWIDTKQNLVFFADATTQGLDVLKPGGELLTSIPVGNIVTSIQRTEKGFYLGCIGDFFPTEERRGQLVFLEQTPRGLVRKQLLAGLPRVAHVEVADLNGDGRQDFALSLFGFLTGRYSWFEDQGEKGFREHILFEKPGAVKSIAHDFNGDGAPDLAVLFGQDTEALVIYTNDGKGNFTSKEVFKRAPTFGHSSFELVDFNGDGRQDFLVTNGDNGDYESPPKSYHGVRIYLAEEEGWTEKYFFPMHGAYGAVARDFDEDGDQDIAAISFFPDYERSPRESFVYLENEGGLKFKASTFPECIMGRWMTIATGDVDGDGDLDLALGSLIEIPTEVPPPLKQVWEKQGPSVLVLKNQLKQPRP